MKRIVAAVGLAMMLAGCAYSGPGPAYYGSGYGYGWSGGVNNTEAVASPAATYGG